MSELFQAFLLSSCFAKGIQSTMKITSPGYTLSKFCYPCNFHGMIRGPSYFTGFEVLGLNTLGGNLTPEQFRRVTRAREPNGDPELCTDCWNGAMKGWHKDLSCVGNSRVVYKDLRDCNNERMLPDGTPCKNDSAMWDSYNTYTNGHGGCCSVWEGDQSPYGRMGSYFCECKHGVLLVVAKCVWDFAKSTPSTM